MNDVIPFEVDIIASEDWMLTGTDHSVMHTHEGQFLLEMIRMSIKDYILVSKQGKLLEAGNYHNTQDAGKNIKNVVWWIFEEGKDGWYYSPLPFEIVCEFLGFHPGVVRKSILRIAREKIEFTNNQLHRHRNTIKKDVANRARDDLVSKEEGDNHACRTITGKT